MGPMDDGRAEPDGLDRVLAAAARERAAHEDDRREPVDQAELAEAVRDKDIDPGFRQIAMRAQRDREARVFGGLGYSGSALRMARRDDRQQRRMFCAQLPMRGDDLILFARMGRGSRDD